MAVGAAPSPIVAFEDWYDKYAIDERTGCLDVRNIGMRGAQLWHKYTRYKTEMDTRVHEYHKLEKLADGAVISPKPDLPNISSGETAGLVRRIARNLVQNTPNVEVISRYDDDSTPGIFARYILTAKIIGSDEYSNDMQQNLFASTKTALTLGFDTVIPVLLQDAAGGWYMKYDTIHYRDVFPEPGAKDVRQAQHVFVRRYLTKGDEHALIADETAGWDIAALKSMLTAAPYGRTQESIDYQSRKFGVVPEGYEIITWYSNSGQPFLTFCANTKYLLRIEKNKHPLKLHPVHFLVLEKDSQQPLGKSQVELLIGRQDFQDLMLNGAMKLWYRNINPSILGYGASNAIPNLTPGKYTQISNPNARIEPFEVNTQTLMQYGVISQQNMGSMVNLVGSADQQMATQAGGGMSATPQGVEAQQAMVDITTNNYQKAIEAFFSRYCSYALTLYFAELKGSVADIVPTADARRNMISAGLKVEDVLDEDGKVIAKADFDEDGKLKVQFDELATEYFVRTIPGSLVEMEDEKQLRVLNQMFIPLSQMMPALAASGDQKALQKATQALMFVIEREIELSGAAHSADIQRLWTQGSSEQDDQRLALTAEFEERLSLADTARGAEIQQLVEDRAEAAEQMKLMRESMDAIMGHLGIPAVHTAPESQEIPL